MNTKNVVMVTHGSQSFENSSASISTTVVDLVASVDQGRMSTKAARRCLVDPEAEASVKRHVRANAASNGRSDNGVWEHHWGAIPNSTFLYVCVRSDGGHGHVYGRAMLWLHEAAPTLKLDFSTPYEAGARAQTIGAFLGRGWVMKLGDMKKLDMPIKQEHYMDFELPETSSLLVFDQEEGTPMPDPVVMVRDGVTEVVALPKTVERRTIRRRISRKRIG